MDIWITGPNRFAHEKQGSFPALRKYGLSRVFEDGPNRYCPAGSLSIQYTESFEK